VEVSLGETFNQTSKNVKIRRKFRNQMLQILLGRPNRRRWDGQGREMYGRGLLLWWGNANKEGHLRDLDVERRIILKAKFKKYSGSVSTGFISFSNRNRRRAVVNTE